MQHSRRGGPVRLLWGVVLAAALGFAFLPGHGAAAHALVASSDPAAGATLASAPSRIVLTFTEQPDLKRSLIQVLDTSGKKLAGGAPEGVAGQPATVARIPVTTTLPKGVYTVSWKSISAVDGHLATGAFAFGVGEAPRPGGPSTAVKSPGASEVGVAGRWFYLGGLMGLLGIAFVQLVVLRGSARPRRLGPALWVSWVAAAGGLLAMTQAQASGAGLGIGDLLSSSIGHASWSGASRCWWQGSGWSLAGAAAGAAAGSAEGSSSSPPSGRCCATSSRAMPPRAPPGCGCTS